MSARYMCISYLLQPNGKHKEVTAFKNNLKIKTLTESTVILDLRDKKVIANRLNPEADFDTMLEMYKRLLGDQLTPHISHVSP